jgi:hypothetical protein
VNGSLEDADLALTQESVEYHSTNTALTSVDPDHLGAEVPQSSAEGAIR